jgi:hypothetical protein
LAITFGAFMLGFCNCVRAARGQAKILLEKQIRAKKKRDTTAVPHLSWTATACAL